MGAYNEAGIYFGIILDEEFVYTHYDPLGACLEEDSEWQGYEYPEEALEAHFDRLCEGTNLHVVCTGDAYSDEFTEHLLCLKEPAVSTSSSSGYGCEFDPSVLDVGAPSEHLFAIHVAKQVGLDWMKAAWHLRWGRG